MNDCAKCGGTHFGERQGSCPLSADYVADKPWPKISVNVYPRTEILKDKKDLFIHGHAGDPIWCMRESDELIGVRLDSGDSGTVYLTNEQARELATQLKKIATLTSSASQ
jgi:hypothetical protein